jgi:hypothetical protein
MHGMARQAVLFGMDRIARDYDFALDFKRGLYVPRRGSLLSAVLRRGVRTTLPSQLMPSLRRTEP